MIMIMVIVDSHDDCCLDVWIGFQNHFNNANGLIDILGWLKTSYGAKIFVEQTLVGSPEG